MQLGSGLLRLWYKLVAAVPIRPLAQKLLYATGVALKRKKKRLMGRGIWSDKRLAGEKLKEF